MKKNLVCKLYKSILVEIEKPGAFRVSVETIESMSPADAFQFVSLCKCELVIPEVFAWSHEHSPNQGSHYSFLSPTIIVDPMELKFSGALELSVHISSKVRSGFIIHMYEITDSEKIVINETSEAQFAYVAEICTQVFTSSHLLTLMKNAYDKKDYLTFDDIAV